MRSLDLLFVFVSCFQFCKSILSKKLKFLSVFCSLSVCSGLPFTI